MGNSWFGKDFIITTSSTYIVCAVFCCVEGYCYLKCSDVVKLLLDTLSDDSNCEMFGPELTNVILKDVLSIRASWFSLSASICHGKSICKQMYCHTALSRMKYDVWWHAVV